MTAEFVRRTALVTQLPPAVEHAARRMLLNVVGTAVGAIASGEVENLVETGQLFGGTPVIAVPGDPRVLDRRHAALVIASAAHAEDFDDTHLASIVHPAASAFGAVYAAATDSDSAAKVLLAFAISCELQIRMALCLETPVRERHPASFTGLFGTMGAALACARLLDLDVAASVEAIALACAGAIGSRQSLGTFAKPLHTGKAASNGLAAAQLAAAGRPWPAIDDPIAAPTGLFTVEFDGRVDLTPMLDRLGEHWEIADIAFKPYPCGVLLHSIIDAAFAVRGKVGDLARIEHVSVACNPAVATDTAVSDPKDSLQAKFSASHAAAAALVDGVLGRHQYEPVRVRDAAIGALRQRISFHPDPAIPKDACIMTVDLAGGDRLVQHIEHAIGSRARPMTDEELLGKVSLLFEDRLPGRARAVWQAIGAMGPDNSLAGLREALAQ